MAIPTPAWATYITVRTRNALIAPLAPKQEADTEQIYRHCSEIVSCWHTFARDTYRLCLRAKVLPWIAPHRIERR